MRAGAVALAAFAALAPARAQNPPHLAYALPAGGQRGTAFEVTLGGQYLQTVSAARVTGGGVEIAVGEHGRPMNGAEAQQLRNRMQELQKQPAAPGAREEMIDIRARLLRFNAQRAISPTLAETVKLRVTIAPGAAAGKRELRLLTPAGLSNPLVFCVGELPEFAEQETIETVPPRAGQPPNQTQITQARTDSEISLPATVNGRIKPRLGTPQQQQRAVQPFTPGDADRYRFHARGGQQLVIAVAARDLTPYLADAVPGWFQAVLTLYDGEGREAAYADDYRFHPDPVIHYAVPRDDEYTIEIRDAIYRGREDFVYRISIGELPFLTGIFPLGGRTGAKTKIALQGWNLPVETTTVNGKGKAAGIYPVAAAGSNALPFQMDSLPAVMAKAGNDSPARAQRVKLPVTIDGRIAQPGQWSVYRFEGRAGQAIVAEVHARRIESPLDSVLKLTDAAGKQIAFNDDFEDKSAGLETHHADSRILTTLPARGTYYLYLGDIEGKGGPEYAYRLRIGAPRPDFDLRVTPSAINLVSGMSAPVTVHAIRRDGFSGEIRVSLAGAPEGLTLAGGVIPEGEDEARLTLTAAPRQQRAPFPLEFEGAASIEGREVRHAAIPADNRMQAFFYWHLVPAEELLAAVRRGGALQQAARIESGEPLKLEAGSTARLRVEVPLPPNSPITKLGYELSEPPDGISVASVVPVPNGAEIVLNCDAAKAKAGLKGNLIVSLSGERAAPAANGRAQAARQRVPLGVLPAIPFEIHAPQASRQADAAAGRVR